MSYIEFLERKKHREQTLGFDPIWMPDFLFDFQRELTDWAIRMGRAALFEDCGLGKTPQSLVWAENIHRHTNKPILILTPLAVAAQFVREGVKFDIEVYHAADGRIRKGINVVNYERLHYFDPLDFGGLVCDESGVLKHHNTQTRRAVTEFSESIRYRLLGTATPAPNDHMELGNSAEVLSVMKFHNMLSMFFVHDGDSTQKWRLRGHAKRRFWQWVSSWARAVRRPSDLGYENKGFDLPDLNLEQYVVQSPKPKHGFLVLNARTLEDQRAERRATIQQRCEQVASLIPKDRPFIAWCHLNAEGDLLERLIPGAVQVSGRDSNQVKEDRLNGFALGEFQVLITKPRIGGFGMNFQHCADMSFFPAHSFEQWYQAVRRCWRFGQQNTVTVNIVTSQAESLVLSNMIRKERQAEEMYDGIVREMRDFQTKKKRNNQVEKQRMELPLWM